MRKTGNYLPKAALSGNRYGQKRGFISRRSLSGVLLILFFGLIPLSVSGQDGVEILEADRIVGGTIEGERVQKILGNVILRSEELTMYCDSAYQFQNNNEVRAYGNIEVNTEEERIWADTLIYFTDVDFSQLRGRVIIESDSTTLYSQAVDYRFSTKVGHFLEPVRLVDQQGVLRAKSGFYYREPDSAVFRGQVQLADTLQYAEGDSLFINRQKEYYELYGDLFVEDRENNVTLKGDYFEEDSTGRRLLKGDAWLKSYESDTTDADSSEADTTHIRSHEIHSDRIKTATDTHSVIDAYKEVRIWSTDFAGRGDTALYRGKTESFELHHRARAWHNRIQLTGPFIEVKLADGDLDSLISFPRPFVAQMDSALKRPHQITGDTLTADFSGGEIRFIQVFGNTHMIRYTKNEQEEADGATELTAPYVKIFFKDRELNEFKANCPCDGSYLPESKQTAERRLNGFSWDPNLRPVRPKEKMEPRWPPIPDTLPFELPDRYTRSLKEKSGN